MYGVVLHAHPVRGESHNQRNTTGGVATVSTWNLVCGRFLIVWKGRKFFTLLTFGCPSYNQLGQVATSSGPDTWQKACFETVFHLTNVEPVAGSSRAV